MIRPVEENLPFLFPIWYLSLALYSDSLFSFSIFQWTSNLEFIQNLFGSFNGNNPFWFLVRNELKSNKQLLKRKKTLFPVWVPNVIWSTHGETLLLKAETMKKEHCLFPKRCKFCNAPGTAKTINALQINFVKLCIKTLCKRKKHSLLLSRSPFYDVVNNFLSSFRVTKVKQLTFFIMKIRKLYRTSKFWPHWEIMCGPVCDVLIFNILEVVF